MNLRLTDGEFLCPTATLSGSLGNTNQVEIVYGCSTTGLLIPYTRILAQIAKDVIFF
jgi:hypothetical protein